MPRLLLVDDNPSIHRIAESLLAPTAIELVCVDSAAEALDRIQNGERFDVAMVDTAMPGMDGWTLVERLRGLEATARMPIALMAGVLDPVDPVKLERAPIQGFLKKPIELRELADRVNALMNASVGAPASVEPLATQPISREDAAAAIAAFPEYTPTIHLPDDVDEDLLVLTASDLWPEEAPAAIAAPAAAVLPQADLELEELDLEGLQGLSAEVSEPLPPAPAFEAPVMPLGEPTRQTPELPELDTLGADELASLLDTDLGEPDMPILPVVEPPAPAPIAFELPEPEPVPLEPFFPPMPVPAPMPAFAPDVEAEELDLPPAPLAPATPVLPAASVLPVSPAPAAAAAAPASSDALVQALLADPQAMSQLTKALVAQLGEEQLKALAWEVLPDLAKKLS